MTIDSPVTLDDIRHAERLVGLTFSEPERDLMLEDVRENRKQYEKLRSAHIPNDVPSALWFDPRLPEMRLPSEQRPLAPSRVTPPARPANLEEAAFWPLTHLAALIEARRATSAELT